MLKLVGFLSRSPDGSESAGSLIFESEFKSVSESCGFFGTMLEFITNVYHKHVECCICSRGSQDF